MSDVIQGSQEWKELRAGKVTASRINDVLATIKSGESASLRNYRAQLVAETLTGVTEDTFCSGPMKWGIENEPAARIAYEFITGNTVEQVAFIDHPSIPMAGASPDGLVGNDGMVEIKCPNTATHIDWLLAGTVPSEHRNQMQFQMDCAGRQWCDFVSYDPRMPVDLQIFIVREHRSDENIVAIRAGVVSLRAQISDIVGRLTAIVAKPVQDTFPGATVE